MSSVRNDLVSSALLVFYVWLMSVAALSTAALVQWAFTSPASRPGFELISYLVVGATLAGVLFVLILPSTASWILLIVVLRNIAARNLLKRLAASVTAASAGFGVCYLFVWASSSSSDGIAAAYLALALVPSIFCIFAFPVLTVVFSRYHRQLGLTPFFGTKV